MEKSAAIDHLADSILEKLRVRKGEFFSLSRLAGEFNADRINIEKALLALELWGYQFNWQAPSQIAFQAAPDKLTNTEIIHNFRSNLFGKNILSFDEVKSTNDIAAQSAEKGTTEGTLVTAESQSAGRGRLGRSWHSPPGKGIYLSIVLKPDFSPEKAPGISLVTALALARTLELSDLAEIKIKWPNDILISGKKVAGILTELSADRAKIKHLIVGVGININHEAADFLPELRQNATSIKIALGHEINRVQFLQQFLIQFEKQYLEYQRSFLEPSLESLRKYSSLIGHEVEINLRDEQLKGKAVDIDSEGRLVLEIKGKKVAVASGEVTVISL